MDFWSEEETFNARSLPYLIALAGALIAGLLLFLPSEDPDTSALVDYQWRQAALLLFLMSGYGAVLEWLGFLPATITFLCLSCAVLGERRILVILAACVPLVIGFWLLMDSLGIYLDPGRWLIWGSQ